MRGQPRLTQLRDERGNLKSPYWYIEYYEGRSRRVSTGCRIGAQDAKANMALAAFTVERTRPVIHAADELTLTQALDDYYEEHAKHCETADDAKRHAVRLKLYLGPTVAQVTNSRVADYIRTCAAQGRSNGTTRRELAYLTAALNHEVREGRLAFAPKFKMPPPPEPRQRVLTPAEVRKLMKACKSDHVRHFIQIMLATGQRPGAVEGLRWDQVDLDALVIHFERSVKRDSRKKARCVPILHCCPSCANFIVGVTLILFWRESPSVRMVSPFGMPLLAV